jgi:putative FmdB family regulatory protein
MPLYDYECSHCGETFEEFRSLKERATAPCPRCGKRARKVLSSFFTNSGGGGKDVPPPPSCRIGGG